MKQQHGASASRVNRRRLPAALVAAFTVTVSTLAILHQGVTTAEVDVDDGGIWVTNSSKRLVGHLNYDSRILDGALRTKTTEFDIGQSGNDVSFTDKTSHSVAPIDVAQVSVGAATSLPENVKVVQGGSRLAVMDPSQGQVWLAQVSSPSGTAYTDEVRWQAIWSRVLLLFPRRALFLRFQPRVAAVLPSRAKANWTA